MLEVIDIWKTYEGKPLLKGISFSLQHGETVCLLGSSGGGKSTLLRIIAGLEKPEQGEIRWNGQDMANTPPHQRNFGLMFQDYALFPHRSVMQNVAFGLRMKGLEKSQIDKRVHDLLLKVNLDGFAKRRVTDLSGGEQQRVALARTLAPDPHLLMLDEPLGALDHTLSEQLATDLRQLLKSTGTPAIYVTHDQQEAFTVADRILIMNEGKIVQEGTPHEVYRFPASMWVARFLGLTNILEGDVISLDPLTIQTELGLITANPQPHSFTIGSRANILIHPEEVSFEPDPDYPNHIHCQVEDAVFQGKDYRVDLCSISKQKHLRLYLPRPFQTGDIINLYLKNSAISCLSN